MVAIIEGFYRNQINSIFSGLNTLKFIVMKLQLLPPVATKLTIKLQIIFVCTLLRHV